MAVGPVIAESLAAIAVLSGLGLLGWLGTEVLRRARERRHGRLVSIDDGGVRPLRSERWRLSGRPDAIRRLPDGRLIAEERKTRPTPPRGPPRSDRVQVAAYSLLLEEATGHSPPYGLLRYSDGGEFRMPWDAAARSELLYVRTAIGRPYGGEARPSPARCRRCPWRSHCDARAD